MIIKYNNLFRDTTIVLNECKKRIKTLKDMSIAEKKYMIEFLKVCNEITFIWDIVAIKELNTTKEK